MIFIQTCIGNGHRLARTVQVGGEVGGHDVRAHVPSRLVVEGGEGRVRPELHDGGLTQQRRQVDCAERPFVPPVVPRTPVVQGFPSHVAQVLLENRTQTVVQPDRFERPRSIPPSVQTEHGPLERLFTFRQQRHVEQVAVKKHRQRNGVAGGDPGVHFGVLKGVGRALNHQARRSDEFANGQARFSVEFVSNLLKMHFVGNDEHQDVKTRLEERRRHRTFQGQAKGVEHADRRSRQRVALLGLQGFIQQALCFPVRVLTNVETDPLGIEAGGLVRSLLWKQQTAGRRKQEENDKHACAQAVGNSSHG